MNSAMEKPFRKAMLLLPPMQVSGPKLVDSARQVLWRQTAFLGNDFHESVVEISKTKHKFFVISFNQATKRFQVIEMYRIQGRKIM